MHTIRSISLARADRKPASVAYALAWLCMLTPACGGDRDLDTTPAPADVDDMVEDTSSKNEAGVPDVTTSRDRIFDAALGTIDAASKPSPMDGAIAARGSDGGKSDAPAGDASAPAPERDAAAPEATPPRPPVDSGSILPPVADASSTIECTTDLAGCLLADPLNVGECLDQLSTCDAVFGGDGGHEAACDTRLATCLLRSPFEIDECTAERMRCLGQP